MADYISEHSGSELDAAIQKVQGLDVFTIGKDGLAPKANKVGDESKFLRGDATWAAVPADNGKADKVANATAGDIAKLDTNGNLADSGFTLGKSVPSDAKFTDTVTTVSVSGSGNAITGMSASNGAITAVKGSTFLVAADIEGKQDKSTAVTHTASTAVGSSTQPVYVAADGKATATSYSLSKSVPSNAIFTDNNVTQSATTSDAEYPVLLAPNGQTATTTTTAYFDSGVTLNPSTNTINANISGKAVKDGDGNVISSTYLKSHQEVVNGAPTLAWDTTSTVGRVGSTNLTVTMPANPNTDTKVIQTPTTSDAEYPVLLAPNGQTTAQTTTSYFDSGVTLNPSTNTLKASITGNAATATKLGTSDIGAANKGIYLDDGTPKAMSYEVNKSVPSNALFTDNNVTQTVTTADATYPVLLAPNGQSATATTTTYFDSGVTLNPNTNTITANITGNAATATTASKIGSADIGATNKPVYVDDGVVKNISYTIDKSVPSNALFTDQNVTQTETADANAEYPVLLAPNGQTTTATTTAYFDSGITVNPSTNTIKANITGNASGTAAVATKLGTAGVGTATKGIYLDDGTPKAMSYELNKTVPSNAIFTDNNVTQTPASTGSYPILLAPNGQSAAATTTSYFDSAVTLDPSTNTITANLIGDVTGNASSATKVGSATVGGATQPVYINGGTPTATSYSLAKSVPSDAIFTDNKVTQTEAADANASYSLLLTPSGQTATATTTSYFDKGVTLNPSTNTITANITGNAGGTAAVATKLGTTTVGASNKGIYLNNGTPTSTSYAVNKEVPSDAIFTDNKVTQTETADANKEYPLLLTPDSQTTATTTTSYFDKGVTLNPSTNTITANLIGNVTGNASTATKINTASAIGAANKPIYVAADGTVTAGSYTIDKSVPSGAIFTDNNVTQTVTTADAAYPLLLAKNGQTATTTATTYFDSGVTLNPNSNTIAANISGNAATATKATQDESGNNIKANYAASASISDHTITLKNKNGGTLSTIVTPDTNQTVGVGDSTFDASGLVKFEGSGATTVTAGSNKITISSTNTTYGLASTSANGLLKQLPSATGATSKLLNGTNDWGTNITTSISSTSTTDVLAAKVGKDLADRITNLESRGRFLSTWNATTGKPLTDPATLPYTYRTGDYFVVGVVGSTNYKPTGTSYTGTASTTVETATLAVNDTYYFDGTTWTLTAGSVVKYDDAMSTTSTNAVQNKVVKAALDTKIDTAGTGLTKSGTTLKHTNAVTAGTAGTTSAQTPGYGSTFNIPYVTYDAQGHVTATGTSTVKIPASDNTNQTVKGNGTAFSANDAVDIVGASGIATAADTTNKKITVSHTNSVTAGTIGQTTAQTPGYGSTFTIPYATFDAQGHITGKGTSTVKIPASDDTNQKVKAGTVTFDANDTVNFVGGAGLSTTGDNSTAGSESITIAHTNAVTALTDQGLRKIAYDAQGHITGSTAVTKSDITALGIPESDTHHTSGTIVNNAATSTSNTTTALTNGNVYLNHIENGAVRNSHKITGSGATSVTSDASGNLTVSSSNTTYSAGTGLALSGTTFNHSNSVTAGTAGEGGSTRTLSHGGSFNVPSVTYDAQGHITGKDSVTLTLPASGDTHYTTGLYVGATEAKSNAATTNGNTYVKLFDNDTRRANLNIKGSGATTVASDASGNITISSTDTNTTYSAGTGLALSGTTFNHSNSVTAGTASEGGSTRTLAYGGSFNVPSVSYDAQGHITGKGSVTLTLPASVDTHYTSKNIVGASATATANAAATNGNVYLNHLEQSTVTSTHKIAGSGATTVTSDASGNITITSTDTNTDTKVTAVGNHYTPSGGTALTPTSAGTASRGSTVVMTGVTRDAAGHITGVTGYTLPASDNTDTKVTAVGNHYTPSGGSALTPSSSGTASRGSTVVMTGITKDAAGHITGVTGYTLPASDNTNTWRNIKMNGTEILGTGTGTGALGLTAGSNVTLTNSSGTITIASTDTKNTAGSTDTSSKIFLVGATSQAANPQTYSDNEVYATSGVLTTKSVQIGGGAATMQYDSTNKCINFVFA